MVLDLIHWAFNNVCSRLKNISFELRVPRQQLLRPHPLWMLGLKYCFISCLVCRTLLRDCACEQPVMTGQHWLCDFAFQCYSTGKVWHINIYNNKNTAAQSASFCFRFFNTFLFFLVILRNTKGVSLFSKAQCDTVKRIYSAFQKTVIIILRNSFETSIHCQGSLKSRFNSLNFKRKTPVRLSICPFLSSCHPLVSVTVCSASESRAVDVPRFGLLFHLWVAVVLFFVAPVITFQLWVTLEKKGKNKTIQIGWLVAVA